MTAGAGSATLGPVCYILRNVWCAAPLIETAPFPWRRVAGTALMLALFIGAVEWLAGWSGVLAALRRLSPAAFAALLSGLIVSYLLRGARLYFYFHDELAGRFWPTLRLTLIHNAMVNLLPLRAGEFSFPVLAKQEFGMPPARTLSALVWFRLLDMMLLATIAVLMAGTKLADSGGGAIALWLLPAAGLPLLVLAMSRERLIRLSGRLSGRMATLTMQVADGLPVSTARRCATW